MIIPDKEVLIAIKEHTEVAFTTHNPYWISRLLVVLAYLYKTLHTVVRH